MFCAPQRWSRSPGGHELGHHPEAGAAPAVLPAAQPGLPAAHLGPLEAELGAQAALGGGVEGQHAVLVDDLALPGRLPLRPGRAGVRRLELLAPHDALVPPAVGRCRRGPGRARRPRGPPTRSWRLSTGDSTEARTTAASDATRPRRGRVRATRGEVMAHDRTSRRAGPSPPAAVAAQEKSLSAVVTVWKTPYASRMLTTAHDSTRRDGAGAAGPAGLLLGQAGLALGLDLGLVRGHVLVELRRHRPHQQVGHEADPEDRHHGEQRRSVGVGGRACPPRRPSRGSR